jgi:hypothetical protein
MQPEPTDCRIVFICDQEGGTETQLKTTLRGMLRSSSVRAAYLARVRYPQGSAVGVALCLDGGEPDQEDLVDKIGRVFLSFRADQHLDIVFLNHTESNEIRETCEPFYETPATGHRVQ